MADFFRERRWWRDHVLKPLSRREQQLAAEALEALDRATRVEGPGRRLSPASVADVEQQRAHAELGAVDELEGEGDALVVHGCRPMRGVKSIEQRARSAAWRHQPVGAATGATRASLSAGPAAQGVAKIPRFWMVVCSSPRMQICESGSFP